MLSKEIIEKVRPEIYDDFQEVCARTNIVSREQAYKNAVGYAFKCVMDELWNDDKPNDPVKAREVISNLKTLGLCRSSKANKEVPLIEEYEVVMENYTYTLHQGLYGVWISTYTQYYASDEIEKMLAGFTPKGNKPAMQLCRVLSYFDRSVPSLLNLAREIEYEAMSDYKKHEIRTATLKALLESELEPEEKLEFYCLGKETQCSITMEDEARVVFSVGDEEFQERLKTLQSEVHDILLNPYARLYKYKHLGYRLENT